MNKLETFASHSGLKINEPLVDESFFPIVHNKYISLNLETAEKSKAYDYWQEVLDLISNELNKEGVKIIQMGGSKTPQLDGVFNLRGMLDFNQESYVIRNSLLHLNSFDFRSSLCDLNKTPCISLISHENPENLIKSNFINIVTPQRKSFSLNPNENKKTINEIAPVTIARKILKELNLDLNLDFSQFFMGKNYPIKTIEIIPDFFPESSFLANSLVNLRADLHFDLDKIHAFTLGRRTGIITDRVFEEGFISASRKGIEKISLEIKSLKDSEVAEILNFLKILKKYKISFELFVRDNKLLTEVRLRFIDYRVSLFEEKTKKDLDKEVKTCDNLFMKSSKIIISNGKKYSTKAHWVLDEPMGDKNQKVIDTSDFWCDLEHYVIYRKDS